jgi:hypothetical protein
VALAILFAAVVRAVGGAFEQAGDDVAHRLATQVAADDQHASSGAQPAREVHERVARLRHHLGNPSLTFNGTWPPNSRTPFYSADGGRVNLTSRPTQKAS